MVFQPIVHKNQEQEKEAQYSQENDLRAIERKIEQAQQRRRKRRPVAAKRTIDDLLGDVEQHEADGPGDHHKNENI